MRIMFSKKTTNFLLFFLIVFYLLFPNSVHSLEIYVRNKIFTDKVLFFKDNIYVPADMLLYLLGFSFRTEENRVIITKEGGRSEDIVPGHGGFVYEDKILNIAMITSEGRVYVPIKSFCEQLGASVLYNKETDILDISMKKNITASDIQKSLDEIKTRREAMKKKWGDISVFRYVIIGSSSAEGAGAEPKTRGFAYQIAERLQSRFQQLEVYNLAIGGANSSQFIQHGVVQTAIGKQPHLILIFPLVDYGMNESEFRGNWDKIFRDFSRQTNAVVVYGKFHSKKSPYDQTLNRIIDELAKIYGIFAVDIPCVFDTQPDTLHPDGIHPNNKGHDAYADLFWQFISTLF